MLNAKACLATVLCTLRADLLTDGNGWNWDRDTFCTTETSPLWPYVIADENCWENSDLEQMQAYGKSCLPSSIAGEI